jgi:hypothetical protein
VFGDVCVCVMIYGFSSHGRLGVCLVEDSPIQTFSRAGLRVKSPFVLSSFDQNWDLSTDFSGNPQYHPLSGLTCRQTGHIF